MQLSRPRPQRILVLSFFYGHLRFSMGCLSGGHSKRGSWGNTRTRVSHEGDITGKRLDGILVGMAVMAAELHTVEHISEREGAFP
jgi:hypothetical protein